MFFIVDKTKVQQNFTYWYAEYTKKTSHDAELILELPTTVAIDAFIKWILVTSDGADFVNIAKEYHDLERRRCELENIISHGFAHND